VLEVLVRGVRSASNLWNQNPEHLENPENPENLGNIRKVPV